MKNIDSTVLEFEKALLQINRMRAAEIFEQCHASGKGFEELELIAIQSLENIGDGWESGTISLSQVYMSGVICEELIDKYLPKFQIKRTDIPKMAIAVLLDHHALGKRIVYSILRAGGFEIMDFGQGLSVEELVSKTVENQIEILLISTLMLPSALKVKIMKEQLASHGATPKIIVGGAPFRLDKNLWLTVGADADGKNASNIIKTIEVLMKGVE
ncbi:cobalamin-binding protein [Acetobacterium fimetarium]|uniref:Cobalamin-binding protein n=1 Tax=Acetobacterium fimetarium TaxID=52691 RepID=A0ABR6WZ28_9FIRM|nr:cobalamin-dependent protein [Acetobacterium fimetarium]MBC3805678.1 cobalamin-binding protein [Acetobacterium fimetarium]